MGTWGVGIFEDDLAADIQSQFEIELEAGSSPSVACQAVLCASTEILSDRDQAPIVHLALASLLLDNGVSRHEELNRALDIIGNREGLNPWKEAEKNQLTARLEVYRQLADRIRSSQGTVRSPRVFKKPVPGNIIEIPLPDGSFAYCHYLAIGFLGALVQVYDHIADKPLSPENVASLDNSPPMFPPFYAGLHHPLRRGRWRIVAHRDVPTIDFPRMRAGFPDPDGNVHVWWICDGATGKRLERFERELPHRYRDLEIQVSWGYESVERRIMTGGNSPFNTGS